MKKILAFAMAAVLMLGLAACGGSGASAPASSAAGSASASSGASGQDSAGGTSVVEEIQEKGVLTMMTATGFPPFEYLGEDGKPAGVDIDLAQLVADELGVELEVLDMDFNLLIESLKSGKGQLIAAGMTATSERAEQIDFSITYTLNGLILLVPKGSDIKTADDLAGKNIAVQESTTAHIYAQEELGIVFPEEDLENYDTINGLLISRLDRIPGDDEQPEIEYLGYRFCVLKVENKMIHSVRVTKLPQTLASEEN